jgi:hypothetical protein
VIGIVALLYAGLFAVEGGGLWLAKRWAECLTIIATTSFVPFEVLRAHSARELAAWRYAWDQPARSGLPAMEGENTEVFVFIETISLGQRTPMVL